MKKVRFKECIFNVDYEATLNMYADMESGSAEACGCIDCLRFAKNRYRVYPQEFLTLSSHLGIDANKEKKLSFGGEFEQGYFYYSGDFYFIGEVLENNCYKIATTGNGGFEPISINPDFEISFSYAFPNKGRTLIEVFFHAKNIKMD